MLSIALSIPAGMLAVAFGIGSTAQIILAKER